MKKWIKAWFSAEAGETKMKKVCGLSWGRTLLKFEKSTSKTAWVMKWPTSDFKVSVVAMDATKESSNVGAVRALKGQGYDLQLISEKGPVVLASFEKEVDANEALAHLCAIWSHEKRSTWVSRAVKIIACVALVFVAMNVVVAFVSTLKTTWNAGEAVVANQTAQKQIGQEGSLPSELDQTALQRLSAPRPPESSLPMDLNDAFAKGK
jgi:hypothetical protein